MRTLLAGVVIVALTLMFWVMVGGVPSETPTPGKDGLQVERMEETVNLSGPGAKSAERAEIVTGGGIRYRIVDGETAVALPYAEIYAIATGDLVARCDQTGVTDLQATDPGQFFYLAEGYLLGFFLPDPLQLRALRGQAKAKNVVIELYRDSISFALELDLRLPNGREVENAEFTLELLDSGDRQRAFLEDLRGRNAEFRRALNNQRTAPRRTARGLQSVPIKPDGIERHSRTRFRLLQTGRYRIEVVSENGLRAEREVWVDARTRRVTLTLARGNVIKGRVFDGVSAEPLADVLVVIDRVPIGESVTSRSDADGRFAFDTLGGQSRRIRMSHVGYQECALSEITPGSELSISLTPLPSWEVQGRVLNHGNGLPVIGAEIRSRSQQITRSHEDGSFALTLFGRDADYLSISAEGYLLIRVAVQPGSGPRDYALIPDQIAARVAAGMTSILSGRVLHADGRPAAGMDLRLSVDGARADSKERAASVTANGLFITPGEVTCDAEGNFAIECSMPGLVSLQPMDGESPPLKVRLALGQRYENLVIYIN